jgi:hypothetical protein
LEIQSSQQSQNVTHILRLGVKFYLVLCVPDDYD